MGFSADYNDTLFTIQETLSRVATNTLVKVLAFIPNTSGGLRAGTVNVQPLVNQVDKAGNAISHGTLYALPYFRMQAGNSAVVLDPIAGDIGMAGFCDHDISSVKANAAQSNPGSARRFDMSDGIYFGGIGSLNGMPTQYIQMGPSGINVVSPMQITLQAPMISLNGNQVSTGTMTNNGVNVSSTHKHGGVQSGSSETGVPNE